jgi:hypothetical protein
MLCIFFDLLQLRRQSSKLSSARIMSAASLRSVALVSVPMAACWRAGASFTKERRHHEYAHGGGSTADTQKGKHLRSWPGSPNFEASSGLCLSTGSARQRLCCLRLIPELLFYDRFVEKTPGLQRLYGLSAIFGRKDINVSCNSDRRIFRIMCP